MDFNKTLSKLLGNNKKIEEVWIDEKVVEEIIKIAINADPKEFVALLSGDIENSILKIYDVPVKIKGVNHHDSDPFKGYAITYDDLIVDLKLMKENNINSIRTSHYP